MTTSLSALTRTTLTNYREWGWGHTISDTNQLGENALSFTILINKLWESRILYEVTKKRSYTIHRNSIVKSVWEVEEKEQNITR